MLYSSKLLLKSLIEVKHSSCLCSSGSEIIDGVDLVPSPSLRIVHIMALGDAVLLHAGPHYAPIQMGYCGISRFDRRII